MTINRKYVIWVHFHKAGAGKGLPWTVHARGQCIPATRVVINVPTETVFKPKKSSNPRAWIRCEGRVVVGRNGHIGSRTVVINP